jgi:hypothetical protein
LPGEGRERNPSKALKRFKSSEKAGSTYEPEASTTIAERPAQEEAMAFAASGRQKLKAAY